ncbi:MAG: carbohydrate-binding domain-containing protein [Chloroflexota bacterium]|nr:MAG: carbohydrate-binding domain-containing protein [Chloroflexota bacterium]
MSDCLRMKRHAVKRKWPMLLTAIIVVITLSGCTKVPPQNAPPPRVPSANAVLIELGDTITVNGSGVMVDGSTVNIMAGGTYSISGTLKDGQILVNTKDKNTVKLILNGVHIASSTSAPIYAPKVKTMIIVLADGAENYVADGDSYLITDSESNEPNAAIFSKGDLTIEGNGSLTVDARYDNGIVSKDKLNIMGGHITVNSVSDGIRGRDRIVIKDGNITVNAKADGMQSNNDEDSAKGFVAIQGGTINISAGEDGIQAETRVLISGGKTTITAGGGSANSRRASTPSIWDVKSNSNSTGTSVSAKGIKASVAVTIQDGTVAIDSSDDAIHSNDRLAINGGNVVLASGDDGIHSDSNLEINGGDLSLTKSYEGIESAVITINAGNIHLASSDDGINIVGSNDGSSINNHLTINGGYIAIDAAGDGLDIDGAVTMTGGTVVVNGPLTSENGALDYDREFKITGGTLVAVGSSGMAQAPDATSTQYSVMKNFSSVQPAGTIVHIETKEGQEILTFAPTKAYQSVVLSSPKLKNGTTYSVFSGGSSTGTATDGLYSGGKYTGGTQTARFTISNMMTIL